MSIKKDRRGQSIGMWTFIEPTDEISLKYGYKWLVKCVCGVEKYKYPGQLRSKNPSCGCISKRGTHFFASNVNKRKPISHSIWFAEYCRYRYGAKNRRYAFDLSLQVFINLCTSNCYYCGSAPSMPARSYKKVLENGLNHYNREPVFYNEIQKTLILRNGIDRIDNTKGYTLENSVACCFICNAGKGAYSLDIFYAWIKRIVIKNKHLLEEQYD